MIRPALFLLLALKVSHAQAQEIQLTHIVQAVCQIESGVVWVGPGEVRGRFTRGTAGEIGPWQTMPYALRDMGFSESRARSSVAYAESAFVSWYSLLLLRSGSHLDALAAYHRGWNGRHRKDAKAYAERAMNLAQRLAKEQQ